jgi:glycosyltransferase involved in cell wall biosynthesis
MKIAHIANRINPLPLGGAELAISLIIQKQIAEGHEVVVYCAEGSQVSGAHEVVALAQPRKNQNFADYVQMTKQQARDAFALLRERTDIDVIHDHTCALAPLSSQLRKPVFLTGHNDVEQTSIFTQGATENTTLVAISYDLQQKLREAGFRVDHVVYEPVELDYLRARPLSTRRRKLCSMGRIHPGKGTHNAVDALLELLALGYDFELHIAGFEPEGEFDFWYRTKIEPFYELPNVTFWDVIDNTQKADFFDGACAFLMLNTPYLTKWNPKRPWEEPQGISPTEAMAMGVPPIVTVGGALIEVIGRAGAAFKCFSDAETVTKTVGLLEAMPLMDYWTPEMVRQESLRFGPDLAGLEYLQIYQSVLG